MIEFLVNDKVCSVTDVGANTTLLEYLREDLKLTGTKEGCASGDCGACTVTLACLSSETQSLEYLSVNSCMTLVGTLDSKQVITVEYLEDGSALHACQKSMVEHHGSQCGFCTPGFVMSLFTYYKTHDGTDVSWYLNIRACRKLQTPSNSRSCCNNPPIR